MDILLCYCYYLTLYDTIRYDNVYLTWSKKLTGSQLSLPHFNGRIKTAEQRTIIQQYGNWYIYWPLMGGLLHLVQRGLDLAGSDLGGLRPGQVLSSQYQMQPTYQRPVYTNFILFDVAL